MNTWQSPVLNYNGPPLPDAKGAPTPKLPTEFDPSGPLYWLFHWNPFATPQEQAELAKKPNQDPVHKAAEVAGKAAGIDPASWQTFIRQTAADWGVYVGLGVLGLLGLVFLVSAGGGGSPPIVIQNVRKKVSSSS